MSAVAKTVSALAILALSAMPALAKDALPWRDANPLERPAGKAPQRRAETSKAAKPAEAAKTSEAAEPADAPTPVPVPEERPASPGDAETPAPVPPADAAKPDPRPPAPGETPEPAASAPLPAPDPNDPADTADRPIEEIPVPDVRPQPTPAEAATPATDAAPAAPVPAIVPAPEPEPTAKPEPAGKPEPVVEPELAPNSTEKLRSREPAVTPEASVRAAAAVEDAIACEAELKTRGAEFEVEETISEGECGVLRPIELKRLSSGVKVTPKTQFLCRSALALDEWMSASVVPAAKAGFKDDALTEFRHASTYVCRPRASESGISEHARGSAIDIGGFVFKSGREVGIASKDAGSPDAAFLDRVRASACGPFKTVLGPGTDADHASHFHLDIAARTNGATYCK